MPGILGHTQDSCDLYRNSIKGNFGLFGKQFRQRPIYATLIIIYRDIIFLVFQTEIAERTAFKERTMHFLQNDGRIQRGVMKIFTERTYLMDRINLG